MRDRRLLRKSGLIGAGCLIAAGLAVLLSTGCFASFGHRPDPAALAPRAKASRFEEGRFDNAVPRENAGPGFRVISEFFLGRGQDREPPGPPPLHDPRPAWKTPPSSGLRVTWLGHSTLLIEMDGKRVLTDPHWGERASPVAWAGPRRFHPPPVKLEELPPLDAIVISHDHYDHLDMSTIRSLAGGGVPFVVPLGVGSRLESWGIQRSRITELDWWGEASLANGGLRLVATPARHFSGRSLTDRNCTLWSSWVIRTDAHRVYFSGDTGLTPQFEEIGKRQGPFDLVMLEVGAFHPSWSDVHLGPDNAVKALKMLGGGPLLPIHWGTSNLALHDWDEPGERLVELAKAHSFPLLTPRLGEPLDIPPTHELAAWWRGVHPVPESKLTSVPSF